MRRFLLWLLPLTAAILAAVLFGFGFLSYLRGDTGTLVGIQGRPSLERQESAPATPKVAAVILGDSLARGTGDEDGRGIGGRLDGELRQRKMPAQRTYNFAVDGARTPDLLSVLKRDNIREIIRESNVVIVSIGGNDLWGRGADWRSAVPPNPDTTMNDVLGRIDEAIQVIRAANPRARIFFVGLYNPFVKTPIGLQITRLVRVWNARLLTRFGSDPNFTLVQTEDLFSHRDRLSVDRFHPGGEGYALIARRIADDL
jgi:lysophospholipase L1-like esterase